ncbi:MAG: hypothetical protein JNJ41_02380 [Bacteroidia bacterium]|nr:hypothetical protein [Bacteroidia bacterium]
MKTAKVVIILISMNYILFSCNGKTVTNVPINKNPSEVIVIPATKIAFKTYTNLPPNFTLDSLSFQDEKSNCSVIMYFPKSNNTKVNESISKFLQKQYNINKPSNGEAEKSNYQISILRLSIQSQLMHCLFLRNTFTSGAAHSNNEALCWNYDTLQNKTISFSEIINFSKKNNKQAFCNKLNGYKNGIDSTDGYKDGLKPTDLTENLNYAIYNNELIIYPNYCCANEGKHFDINLKEIQHFINPIAGKYYKLIIPE